MSLHKKWVFTELVKDPNNLEQLLSYAIYKGFKDEIARNARSEDKSATEIEQELTHYHNQCLVSQQQLEVFRTKAKSTLESYVSIVSKQLQANLEDAFKKQHAEKEKDIKKLEKQLKEAEKTALKKFSNGALEYSKKINTPTGWGWCKAQLWRLCLFLFSGVPKLIATAFSLGILFAIVAAFSNDATTAVRTGLFKAVDIVAPSKPNTPETTSIKKLDN